MLLSEGTEIPTLAEVIEGYETAKKQAEFEVMVPEDKLWHYIWGSTIGFMKPVFLGNMTSDYLNPMLNESPIIADLCILDLLKQELCAGNL